MRPLPLPCGTVGYTLSRRVQSDTRIIVGTFHPRTAATTPPARLRKGEGVQFNTLWAPVLECARAHTRAPHGQARSFFPPLDPLCGSLPAFHIGTFRRKLNPRSRLDVRAPEARILTPFTLDGGSDVVGDIAWAIRETN